MGHARRYLIEAVDDYRLNKFTQQIVNACATVEERRLKRYRLNKFRQQIVNVCATVEERRFSAA